MSESVEGWFIDPLGRHAYRYFSYGRPTDRVLDGGVESIDPFDVAPVPSPAQPREQSLEPRAFYDGPIDPHQYAPVPVGSQQAAVPQANGALSYLYSDPAADTSWVRPAPPRVRRGRVLALLVAVVVAVALMAVVIRANIRHAAPSDTASSLGSSVSASSPVAAPVALAPGGYDYTSSSGHFSVRFAEEPVEKSVPESISGVTINVFVAVTRAPVAEVASESTSTKVPSAQWAEAMRVGLASVAAAANLTVQSQSETTFRGYAARTATYVSSTGTKLEALVFMYSGTRLYFILAEDHDILVQMESSFVALP